MLWILVNTGSDNGYVPDGTKPLSEPIVAFNQLGPYDISKIINFVHCLRSLQ